MLPIVHGKAITEMASNCNGHEPYYTRPEADAALRRLITDLKRSGRSGKSFKRLRVFQCGNHFHVGRANAWPKNFRKQPKPPTPGELRRKEKHEQKAAERSVGRKAKHVFAQLGFFIEVENAAKAAKFAVDDLADSMEHARKMSERFVFVK